MVLEKLNALSHWQIDLIAFLLLIQGAVVSIAPEEVVIVALGLLWGHGKITFIEASIVILLGILPANILLVLFGEKFAKRFEKKRAVQIASNYLRRYGALVIVLTRFTPVVKGPVYFSVGALRFGLGRFLLTDLLAALVQVPLLLLLGKTIGENSESIEHALRTVGWIAGSMLALSLLITIRLESRQYLDRKNASS
jgi:membrane protein DedA with SNARE-associated domain